MFNIIVLQIKRYCLICKKEEHVKNQFMRVEKVAQELEVSRSYAYRLIRQLNAELHEKGYMTIAGRVNRLYFQERLYGTSNQKECESHVNTQG